MSNTRVIAAVLCAMMCATESAAQSVRPSAPIRVLPLSIGTAPSPGATPGILPVIRTRQGDVEGLNASGLSIFKGIPYAAPPVGDLRWRSPNPPAPWRGVRKAEKFGDACVQNPKLSIDNGGDPGSISEDCLYLNVWSPNANPSARLPVMVWIHGGALIFGSGSVPLYDGSPMARRGAVVVTLNYRLGQLGFFSHPALDKESRNGPVNFGLLDQIAALRWVQQNIAAFGGDAGNVTILGESAGAQSVLAMFTSPLAKGLFRKGIAQSPYGIPIAARAQAREAGVRVADTLGLRGASATAAELRAVEADRFRDLGGRGLSVQPVFVVGDAALPRPILDVFQSGAESRQPLIVGSNSDDASVVRTFGVDPAAVVQRLGAARILVKPLYPGIEEPGELGRQSMRDIVFTVFSRRIAWLHSRNAPAWWYYFDYVPVNLRSQQPGAAHGVEIAFALGTGPECGCTGSTFVDADREMARRVADYWFAFARGGKPSPAGAIAWPQYHANNDRTMEFGNTIAVRTDFMKGRLRAFTGGLNVAGKMLGRN